MTKKQEFLQEMVAGAQNEESKAYAQRLLDRENTLLTIYSRRIEALPKLKRVSKDDQRQQIIPGLQVGKQLSLL